MKQIQQSYRRGGTHIVVVPAGKSESQTALVSTEYSLISAGTERMIVDLAGKSALGKARARPDLARQVIDKVRQEGLWSTWDKVRNKLETPIPLGYSLAGKVVDAGANAGVAVGTRVAAGGAGVANHAESNIVPKNLMVPVPEGVTSENASFVTVGAIALQGVRQAAPTIGERVGVIGLGLVGQLTVQILKANGCDVIGMDIDPWKLDVAMSCGADLVALPDRFVPNATAYTGHRGLDAVIITASTKSDQPIKDAGLAMRRKGRVVSVGLTNLDVPRDLYYYKELDLRLSHAYGPGRHDPQYEHRGIDYPFEYVRWTERRNFEAFLRLIERGAVNPQALITHRFKFEDALAAYELITAGDEKYLGIVLEYGAGEESQKREHTITLENTLKPHRDIRLAVLGTGAFARSVLLPRIKKHRRVTRCVAASRTGISARHAAERYRFARASTDYNAVLADPEINTLFITTRHDNHAGLVRAAIDNGKHVFVEKPLAIGYDELSELESTYDGTTIVQVGFNRRFSSHADIARAEIAGRQAVVAYRVNAGDIPFESWIHDRRVGGGRIIGEVCHFIDFAAFVLDARPVRVSCLGPPGRQTHDDVVVTLTYGNGSVATITYLAKGNARLPKEAIEIFAEGTAITIDNFLKTVVYSRGRKRTHKGSKQDKGFDQEIDAFFDSILNGKPAISFASMVQTTRATLAAVESLQSGGHMLL